MSNDTPIAFSDAVTAYYDRLAPTYGDGELFAARRASLLAVIEGEMAASRRILDLGCGNGTFTAELGRLAPSAQVVGADLSPEMLRATRGRLGNDARLAQCDAQALPFRDGSFDLVFMSHVMLLIPDIERCLVEIAGCLSRHGCIAATIRSPGWRDPLAQVLTADDMNELGRFVTFTLAGRRDSVRRVAAACGKARLDAEWRSAPFSVSWPALLEWLHIRWFAHLDDERQADAAAWVERVRGQLPATPMQMQETVLVATKW